MKHTLLVISLMLLTALNTWAAGPGDIIDLDDAQVEKELILDGIDVSDHQKDIDWRATAANKKIKFVYVKATEGATYSSRRYLYNIENARKHGIKVGSYHFVRTGSRIRDQFENFKRVAKKADQDLIPLIDIEVRQGWTNQQVRDSVKLFADLVEEYYGVKPMIYTNASFFNNILGATFADYPLFIARYASNEPTLGCGAKWTLWQFSERGRIKGIDHNVDLCRFNKGCSLKDILVKNNKLTGRKNRASEEVDRNHDKPSTIDGEPKEPPTLSKRQQRELEKQQKKEQQAKERAEKLAKEKAEKEAKQNAEKEAKKKAEKAAKEKAEKEAKEKAEKEAKKKAEKEAKAKAERAEREAKAKAEKEAKAKAEKEAKAKAEKEAKEKAEKEAKEKAEKEAKAKAEKAAKEQAALQNAAQAAAAKKTPTNKQKQREQRAKRQQQVKSGTSTDNAKAKATPTRSRKTNKSSADND